ncbi:hypothetical protein D9M70_643870 [compost metagenome]
MLPQVIDLFECHFVDRRTLGAFEPQLHCQLVAGAVADVLAIEPALQVGVVSAVLALHDSL